MTLSSLRHNSAVALTIDTEVRSLYDGMARIVVTPTWVKLIDFETTIPSAVAEPSSGMNVSAPERHLVRRIEIGPALLQSEPTARL